MILNIVIVLAALVVVFLIIAALQPAAFRYQRSGSVSAPPPVVFAQVNDLHAWEAWNPWGKIDPAVRITYTGPQAGVGASYAWVGNNKVGEGRMTITEGRPYELIRLKLEFLKPFAATNEAEFTFKPEGSQTIVTWSMSGRRNFVMKAMGLVMNMEKMIGAQFEKGLADMKAAAEASAVAR